jgi:hypothetical protein
MLVLLRPFLYKRVLYSICFHKVIAYWPTCSGRVNIFATIEECERLETSFCVLFSGLGAMKEETAIIIGGIQ